jgi:hypothetical protein
MDYPDCPWDRCPAEWEAAGHFSFIAMISGLLFSVFRRHQVARVYFGWIQFLLETQKWDQVTVCLAGQSAG